MREYCGLLRFYRGMRLLSLTTAASAAYPSPKLLGRLLAIRETRSAKKKIALNFVNESISTINRREPAAKQVESRRAALAPAARLSVQP